MNANQIFEAAVVAAGHDELESDSFREGLTLIVSELDRVADLPPAGRKRLEGQAVSFLTNRLRTAAYIRDHPQVLDTPVTRPVFVFGMPRTGTTLVSNLLWQDPARRTLLNWEAMETAPPAASGALTTDPRVEARRELLAMANKAFPNLNRAHAEFADGPTECLSLHKQEFRALWWDAQAHIPAYTEWLLSCDMRPAYAWHKRALQVMQSTNPGPWQLKMPSHALYLDALLATYPDARLVWTHRDPLKATGSLFSLIETVRSMNMTPVYAELRTNYTRQAVEHMRRPMELKRRRGAGIMYDVHYAELLRDPIATMRNLYAYLGDPFTPDAEAGMRRWLAENPQGKFGKHSYTLEKYGASADELRPHFEDYVAEYEIEPEG